MNKTEKDPEDEAFEELTLKQGQWHHISGWRKRQIEQRTEGVERNAVLEEVAVNLETKFTGPFGRDTVASFANFVRSMKR